GRMGRLAYFGWSIVTTVFLSIVAFLANILDLVGQRADNKILLILGLILAVLGIVLTLWAGASIGAKRLHDMNLPGFNIIWILGLYLAWPALSIMSFDDVAIVDKVIVAIVALVMLFGPGTNGRNHYG
ncbi:MAG: hypothetical protein B7Z71_05415, partial [Acidocella sp. 21-58-7]